MAITNAIMQMRRGLEADFDPDKMRPGEWAVSTDKKYVRMCFFPGVCVRMATYEAFEADMSKIQAILSEVQTIEEAVIRINEEVSANADAVVEYTEQAKQYCDEAKQFRDEAETSATNAKTSEDKAKVSETNAKISEENARRVAESLPEDYTELSKAFYNTAIKQKAVGENIHVTDSAEARNVEFGLYGKATQDGEPTPDNPIEITVSGSDGSVGVVSCGKNLLENMATSQTINGVTFTVNEDGSVTCNGTATATCQLYYDFTANISVNDLILSGCPSGGTFSNYWLTLSDRTEPKNYIDYGNGTECSLVKGHTYSVVFVIYNGQTVSDFTFYPMISVEGGEYEPYKETTATIPTPNGLPGIPVSSGGNYTDENGQQWISDVKIKYADGTGKYVQRIYKKVFDGTENINVNTTSSGGGYYFYYSDNLFYSPLNQNTMPNAICNKLLPTTGNALWSNDVPKFALYEKSGSFRFRFPNLGITTVGDMKAKLLEWYENGEPLVVISEIREPITTPLTAEEIAEIEKLQTFYPVTNISNDADCGMAVTYMADAKNYIDNIILSRVATLETAVINNL